MMIHLGVLGEEVKLEVLELGHCWKQWPAQHHYHQQLAFLPLPVGVAFLVEVLLPLLPGLSLARKAWVRQVLWLAIWGNTTTRLERSPTKPSNQPRQALARLLAPPLAGAGATWEIFLCGSRAKCVTLTVYNHATLTNVPSKTTRFSRKNRKVGVQRRDASSMFGGHVRPRTPAI